MNGYVAGGLLAAFIAWSGGMYYAGGRNQTHICAEADAKHDVAQAGVTIAAQENVIGNIQKQNTINRGASDAFQIQIDSINGRYSDGLDSVQPAGVATGNGVRAVPVPASGISAPICEKTSKQYKLTFKQCDIEEAKLKALWDAWNAQAAIK